MTHAHHTVVLALWVAFALGLSACGGKDGGAHGEDEPSPSRRECRELDNAHKKSKELYFLGLSVRTQKLFDKRYGEVLRMDKDTCNRGHSFACVDAAKRLDPEFPSVKLAMKSAKAAKVYWDKSVELDARIARCWKKECSHGQPESCERLADWRSRKGDRIGASSSADWALGAHEKGCKAGKVESCLSLGGAKGGKEKVVSMDSAKYLKRAHDLLQIECEQKKEAASCTRLGRMYVKGEGVGADVDRAVAFFEKACEVDRLGIQRMVVADAYARGRYWSKRIPRNDARALEIYVDVCGSDRAIKHYRERACKEACKRGHTEVCPAPRKRP